MLRRRFLFTKVSVEKPVYKYTYTTTDGLMLDLKDVQNHKYENGIGTFETYSTTCVKFENEYTLESIVIPKGVISIGDSAFYDCTGLTSITIPNSVTSIGNRAFSYCSELTSITIPKGVIIIKDYAFYSCYGLTNIIIPNSVTSIGGWAFERCYGSTSVIIGNSVANIGSYAFGSCYGLINVTVETGNTKYDSRNSCNAIIETATNTLIVGCKNTTIPNGVISIGKGAFNGCEALTNIIIPNSVTSIGEKAFSGCINLKTVINLSNITFMKGTNNNGYVAYYADDVYNLPEGFIENDFVLGKVNGVNTLACYLGNATELILPADYKGENYVINYGVFKDNKTITSIEISDSITSIGNSAFYGCSGLTGELIIPNSVTSIGVSAFSNCTGFTSVDIGNGVTSIGGGAFRGCTGLTSITIPNSVTSIGYNAFEGTAWYNNQPDGLMYVGKLLYKYKGTIPENTSITVKDGTLGITHYAFEGCSGLISIVIPNSVTWIGDYAFEGCSGLTSVVIGNSVINIGKCAFDYCAQLNEITSLNPTPPVLNYNTFSNIGANGVLKIPKGSDYSSWMKTSMHYLGYYNWTVEEI